MNARTISIFKLAGLVLAALLFLILLNWNGMNAPLGRDQGAYSYSAWLLRQNIAPYTHSFEHKPPMIIYTYALAQLIDENANWPPRLLAALFTLAAAALIGLIARKEAGNAAGAIAVFLFIRMMVLPHLWGFGANTEVFMVLPLTGVLGLYILKGPKSGWRTWVAAGMLASSSIFYKPIAIPSLILIFLIWAIDSWRARRETGSIVCNILAAAAGSLLASLLILGYFLINDGGRAFWEQAVVFNQYYAGLNYGLAWDSFRSSISSLLNEWWILFLLPVPFLIKRPSRWWLYTVLLLIAFATSFQDLNGSYYMLAVPFWSLIAAMGIIAITGLKFFDKYRIWANLFLAAVVLIILLIPIREQLSLSPDRFSLLAYGRANPFLESPLVADKLRALTGPNDHVFVAGSEAQILYYAKRKSSTRFISMYPLMIGTPLAAKYQAETVKELEKDPPKAIVLANSPYSWLVWNGSPRILLPYLNKLLVARYSLVGGFIVDRDFGFWQDAPVDPRLLNYSSLLLFKRK
ncbi:MAG TPA: glycosyltransferase family 39 protein [Candidatus Omnitrophota bacterium]|nr:glycosyltransferase family 39 protein [Candidatus Omnitrophota bacterium]